MKIAIETGNIREFIKYLKRQKKWLLNHASCSEVDGLIAMIDEIQDTLVDDYGFEENEVFDFKEE